MTEKILYTVDEVLECNGGLLPLSKSAVYKLIRQKQIPSKRIGKRVFILSSFIDDLTTPDAEKPVNCF